MKNLLACDRYPYAAVWTRLLPQQHGLLHVTNAVRVLYYTSFQFRHFVPPTLKKVFKE